MRSRTVTSLFLSAQEPDREEEDFVTIEAPLEIVADGHVLTVTMRTPGDDKELAAGFLFNEGIIEKRDQFRPILPSQRNNSIEITLPQNLALDLEEHRRHFLASSSCGLCGRTSLDAVESSSTPICFEESIDRSLLRQLPKRMAEQQPTFNETGGLHAAAIFSREGTLISLREDIGRHNAVDKVIGALLLDDRIGEACILMASGRASFEIVQKAQVARIPIVAAISAVSSLAIQSAQRSEQTLIGFLRPDGMRVYSRPDRIDGS